MINESKLHESHHEHHLCGGYVSWSAIILGAILAFGISFLFNLFNAGLGLLSFGANQQTLVNAGVGGYIWLVISGIISMFIAGWVAGHAARHYGFGPRSGILHAFAAWCLALIVLVVLAAHVSAPHILANATMGNAPSATTIGKFTFAGFIIFVLGAIAACLGGYLGAQVVPKARLHTHSHL